MSIIYDALQKTQKNHEYLKLQNALSQKNIHRSSIRWKIVVTFMLVISAGLGAIVYFYGLPLRGLVKVQNSVLHSSAKTVEAIVPRAAHPWVTENSRSNIDKPLSGAAGKVLTQGPVLARDSSILAPSVDATLANSFTLNGVMVSGLEKIALINNQAFHLGDVIGDMKIISIDFTFVKLQKDQQIIELRVPV